MADPDFRALCAQAAEHLSLLDDPPHQLVIALQEALSQPPPEPPTDDELKQLLFDDYRTAIEFVCESEPEGDLIIQSHLRFARAVFARWGQGNG